jgi:hypothetical protein
MLDLLLKLRDRLPVSPDVALRRFALRCVEALEVAPHPMSRRCSMPQRAT